MSLLSQPVVRLLAVLAVLTACGADEAPARAPTLSLTASQQSVSARGAPVALMATGGTESYLWSISPAMESGSAGGLSETTGARVKYLPPLGIAGPRDVTITVSSGNERASVVLRVLPHFAEGRVVTADGLPVPGITVAVRRQDGTFERTTSDASGAFRVEVTSSEYDLVLVDSAKNRVTVYEKLTAPKPVVTPYDDSVPLPPHPGVSIGGTLIGGGTAPAAPATLTTGVALVTNFLQRAGPSSVLAEGSTGAYSLEGFVWRGVSDTAVGTLHALQVQRDAEGKPTGFPGYGVLEGLSLRAGERLQDKDLVLRPVGSLSLPLMLRPPEGVSVLGRTVWVAFDSSGSNPEGLIELYRGDANGMLTLTTPDLPEGWLVHRIDSSSSSGTVSQYGITRLSGADVHFSLERAHTRVQPAPGATGVGPGTPFSWSSQEGRLHTLKIAAASGGGPTLVFFTSGQGLTLPDLSALGVSLPRGEAYTWSLSSVGWVANIDSLVDEGCYLELVTLASSLEYVSDSGSGSFTTAP